MEKLRSELYVACDPALLLDRLPDKVLDSSIATVRLGDSLTRVLTRCQIRTWRDVRQYSFLELSKLRNMSFSRAQQVVRYILQLVRRHRNHPPELASVLSRISPSVLADSSPVLHPDSDVARALATNGISTFGQLRKFTTRGLLALPGFQTEIVIKIVQYLREKEYVIFDEVLTRRSSHSSGSIKTDLGSLVRCHLHCLSMRPHRARLENVLHSYWGGSSTLDAIGKKRGVSKGSLCQQISAYCKDLNDSIGAILRHKISALLSKRGEPLFLESLGKEDAWFGELELLPFGIDRLLFLGKMIESVLKDCHLSRFDGRRILTYGNPEAVQKLLSHCIWKLSKTPALMLTVEGAEALVLQECTRARAPELARSIFKKIEPRFLHLVGEDGEVTVMIGSAVRALVVLVFTESGCPLSTEEIVHRCNQKTSQKLSSRMIRKVLSKIAQRTETGQWNLQRASGLEAHNNPHPEAGGHAGSRWKFSWEGGLKRKLSYRQQGRYLIRSRCIRSNRGIKFCTLD